MASFDVPKRLHAAQHATGQPDAITPASIGAAPASRFLTGTGSPEGVTAAPIGTTYTDTAATAGAVEWTKFTGTGTTGWRVTKGDTGWRKLDLSCYRNGATPASAGVRLKRIPEGLWLFAEINTPAEWVSNNTAALLPAWAAPDFSYPPVGYAQQSYFFSGAGSLRELHLSGSGANPARRSGWTLVPCSAPWPTALTDTTSI